MTANTTSGMLHLNDSLAEDDNSDDHDKTLTKLNTGFEFRNMFIGSFGIVFNSLAFFVISKSKKLSKSRKLMLLNLVGSDIFLSVALCIYGVVDATQTSGGEGCIPMVIAIVLSILTSYLFALLLSAVNYLAVKKPHTYRLLKMQHCGIAVASVWVLCLGLCVAFVVFSQRSPGLTCAPVVIMSRQGTAMSAVIPLISFLGVMFLNTAVVMRLRQSVQSFRGEAKNNPGQSTLTGSTGQQHQNKLETILRALRLSRNKVAPMELGTNCTRSTATPNTKLTNCPDTETTPDAKTINCPRLDTTPDTETTNYSPPDSTPDTKSTNCPRSQVTSDNKTTRCPCPARNSSVVGRGACPCEFVPRAALPASLIKVQPRPGEPGASHAASSPTSPLATGRASSGRVCGSSAASTSGDNIDKICKTLLILTSYSCLMTLPLILYLICIGSYVIADPENVVSTSVGILLSSLPMMNACINPFFYALQFINWRVLKARVGGRCSCRWSMCRRKDPLPLTNAA